MDPIFRMVVCRLNQGEVKWLVLMLAALLLGLLLIWLGVAHKSWNRYA